jgi:excinuclease UvrABC helicase subunit UvrB
MSKKTQTIYLDQSDQFSRSHYALSTELNEDAKNQINELIDERCSTLVKSVKALELEKKIQRRKKWINAMKQRRH